MVVTNGEDEGHIESVKHVEWLMVGFFLWHILHATKFPPVELIVFIVGAQFPDVLEGLTFRVTWTAERRRALTHTPLPAVLLLVLAYGLTGTSLSPLVWVFAVGYLGHLTVDVFAGGDPVYLLGPFVASTGAFQVIDEERRLMFGQKVFDAVGYLWPEQTNGDLAWFWILQFFGAFLAAVLFCVYLFVIL